MSADHPRLDKLLVARGLFASRNRAQGAIMAGLVYVNGQHVDKAGTRVSPEASIEVRGPRLPYVGRGGLKLEKALDIWDIPVDGAVCMDVGASTGGFTDCLLQNGARLVFSIDVGYGQLAWKLRQDPRVVVLERLNARYLEPAHLEHEGHSWTPSVATVDVSFISLQLVLPPVFAAMEPASSLVVLVKPQFEAGQDRVGKGGIVRDPQVHRDVLAKFCTFAASHGARILDFTHSPVTGGDGNIEFLVHMLAPAAQGHGDVIIGGTPLQEKVDQVVSRARVALGARAEQP